MKLKATKRAIAYALRAYMRIGELSRELEKATGDEQPKEILLIDGKNSTKEQTLAAARISTTTAHRYEQLLGRGLLHFWQVDGIDNQAVGLSRSDA